MISFDHFSIFSKFHIFTMGRLYHDDSREIAKKFFKMLVRYFIEQQLHVFGWRSYLLTNVQALSPSDLGIPSFCIAFSAWGKDASIKLGRPGIRQRPLTSQSKELLGCRQEQLQAEAKHLQRIHCSGQGKPRRDSVNSCLEGGELNWEKIR